MERIRPAVPADVDTLVAVHRAARDTYYRGVVPDRELDDPAEIAELREASERSIPAPDRTVLVAEADGEAIGFTALGPPFEPVTDADPGTVGQLFGLYVLPARWGAGIGGRLHDRALAVWREAGIITGRLEVWERNERASAFYARRGWRPDGHRRDGVGGADFVRLVLRVPG
jgi:GNAT superfamily N-acetyltransferase